MSMKIISNIEKMNQYAQSLTRKGFKIGFVPTMGALHEGHISLVRLAKKYSEKVIVSIFVNPIQFGPKEDYKRYPRTFENDCKLLKKENVDAVFYPSPNDMFPEGFSTYVEVDAGKSKGLDKKLCGISRPGHFRGVTTVVAKLFNIINPDIAVFGAKDFQQQLIIKKMVKDLNYKVKIITAPTYRERDGLAMSSRNSYLSSSQRHQATALYKSLLLAKRMILSNEKSPKKIISIMKKFIEANIGIKIDYISVVDPNTLEDVKEIKRPVLIAIAAFLGKTRLIDNMVI